MDIILSIPFLVFLPLLVSLTVISPLFTNNEITVRRFAQGFFSFHFLYSVLMYACFDSANPYVSEINFFGLDWIQSLGISFSFKASPISMILIVLTSFVFLISSIASKFTIRQNHKLYYSMLMLLMSAILGIFTAADMFLFFLFWELELIPAYFLIAAGENENSKSSAMKFVLFTFFGSMFMLLGILLLHHYNFISNGILSANFDNIIGTTIPAGIQTIVSICFLIGFGVKLPIIPLHTWLPDAHTNAPTPVSMILAGILLKTGAYGIYKFNYSLLPENFLEISYILGILAFVNIIYTAFVAYAQQDIKRIVAYSSISNMGLVLLGLCAFNKMGLSASVFHMVAHGLVTCGLFMITGIVYLRCKTRDIDSLGGIANVMPRLYFFATLIILASIGIPFFAPFVSEILTILGALNSNFSDVLKYVSVGVLPLLILSSCYMLKFLHKGFYGETKLEFEKINDISLHEFIVLASILLGLVIFGIFPNVILGMLQ